MWVDRSSGAVHWTDVSMTPFCLSASTRYFFGADETGDHWSAIYNAPGGQPSYSVQNGDFNNRFASDPIALRMFGNAGCGGPPCPADCDENGVVNTLDFLCFLNKFVQGDPGADCDGSGQINTLDFLCFLNAFNEGCP